MDTDQRHSTMSWAGLAYRNELKGWIDTRPKEIECLEITAEHFFEGHDDYLHQLSLDYPLFVHGLGLSLGTPGPLDTDTLKQFARVVEIADPEWISEHIAFTRSDEVDLGHLNPIQPSRHMLEVVADHARQVSQICGKPIILENITSHLALQGEMSEVEFINRLCAEADCGLLLDVTNLFINSRNHQFDARAWLHELDPKRIVQLHVVGYTERDGRFHDLHSQDIQKDLWDLINDVLDYAPVRAVIIERDKDFPPTVSLTQELLALKEALENH